MTANMIFNTFCNICFTKENIIKFCREENEPILNILISFTSCPDTVNGIIYLCINCCNKLEEYDNFREMCLTNFVRFRYLYNEYKKQLEIRNAPDIEIQLKAFVEINVERPSGTPLIEDYIATQALTNDTTCNIESDEEFTKINLDELLNKNDKTHADISFTKKNNTLENNTQTCSEKYENDSLSEDQENNSVLKRSTDNENKTETSVTHNMCDGMFQCNSDLDVHMRTHTDEKHYKCDKCQKTFTDTNKFKIHTYFHSTKGPYKCDECGYKSTIAANFKRHKRTHTGEKPYKCDECKKGFVNQSNLRKHKFIHTGEKPYKCEECGYTCIKPINLKIHKLTHTGEKPYKCDECSLAFKRRNDLKSHTLIHTGEKPYKCDECGLAFRHRTNLKTHKRIHTGEKPYKCEECGLEFTQRSSLSSHKLIHTGEKPYKCDECDYRCTYRHNLKKHKLKHTREKPVKFDECCLGVAQESTLNTPTKNPTNVTNVASNLHNDSL